LNASAGRVLVAGASGRLGREILAELRRLGRPARALVRDASRLDAADAQGVELFVADARQPNTVTGACDGATVVISALGASLRLGRTRDGATFREVDFLANLNLLAEALRARVPKFVYVSLCGAESLRGRAYADEHERFVRGLRESGIDYAVVRPTGFFYVFAELLRMARRGLGVVVGDGRARTNPVHERDVARACAEAAASNERELPVGGPEVFTRREIAELAFEVLGKRPRIVSVPAGLMRAMALPARPLDRRLYDLLDFGVAAGTVDLLAPRYGTRTLRDYFADLTKQ
jgi:uncharacterized protein YbjT (DUF2867 family)